MSLIQRNQQRLVKILEIKGSMLNLQVIILPTLRRIRLFFFFCGKNDHFKKECRFYKRLKTEANIGQKKANIVERPPSPSEIIAMIAELKISMIT